MTKLSDNDSSPTSTSTTSTTTSTTNHTQDIPHIEADRCGCGCDWGENGGKLCGDCFKCSPCCGDPCTFKKCLYCCCLFSWCGICVHSKMYAYSLEQECAVINHCCPLYCLPCIFAAIVRSNLRQMANVGDPGLVPGDALVPWCFCVSCCGSLQEIRSVPIEAWDICAPDAHIQCFIEPMIIVRPLPKMMEQ